MNIKIVKPIKELQINCRKCGTAGTFQVSAFENIPTYSSAKMLRIKCPYCKKEIYAKVVTE